MKRLLLFPLLFITFASFAIGITPEEFTTASALWQRLWNQGELFSPPLDPTADKDGDGQSNYHEFLAGTNPQSGTPPTGLATLQITHTPATYLTSPNGGAPQILTPEVANITWLSVLGKSHQLWYSPDLSAGSWSPVGTPLTGDGNPMGKVVTLTQPDGSTAPKLFFRLETGDTPSTRPGNNGVTTAYDDGIRDQHPEFPTTTGNGGTGGNGGNPPEPDSDHDGLADSADALPDDALINWKKTPTFQYLWVPVENPPAGYRAISVNNKGQILFQNDTFVQTVGGLSWINNLPTTPVGKVWDPAKPAAERWKDLLLKVSPFSLQVATRNSNQEQWTKQLRQIDFPQGVSIPRFRLGCLGDDGSVMANLGIAYNWGEPIPNSSQTNYYQTADIATVVLWKSDEHGAYDHCKLLGENRGYESINETDRVSKMNHAAGFHTDTGGTLHAAMYDDRMSAAPNPVHNTTILSHPITGDAIGTAITLPGLSARSTDSTATSFTRSGRALFGDVIDGDLKFFASAGRTEIPRATAETTLTDLPDGGWAVGGATAALQIFKDGELKNTSLSGITQLDELGTGIGSGLNDHAIWRNGEWLSLRDATGKTDFPTTLKPRELTSQGIIWAGDENANGVLIPVVLNSMDRFLAGSIQESTILSMGGNSKVGLVLRNTASNEEYRFEKISDAHVYDHPFGSNLDEEDQILSNGEVAKGATPSTASDIELNQEVVFYRKDGMLHFRALFDHDGDIEVGLLVDNVEIGKTQWKLTADAEIGDLLETIDSILAGTYEDVDDIPTIAARSGLDAHDVALMKNAAAQMRNASPQARASFFGFIKRNLTIKVNIPTWEAAKEHFENGVRAAGEVATRAVTLIAITGKGFCEGAWYGVKDDAMSLIELGKMILNPIETAKTFYEGFRVLLKLNFQQLQNVGKSLVKSFVDKGEEGVDGWAPPDAFNVAAYLTGFTAGFIAEQIVVTYVTAGVLKAGNVGAKVGEFIRKASKGILAPLAEGAAVVRKQAMKAKNSVFRRFSQNVLTENEVKVLKRMLQELEIHCPAS